jgi:FkbM family methyltransferase
MLIKELFQHRIRDLDAIFRTNKRILLFKYIFLRTIYLMVKKDDSKLGNLIPESFSNLNDLKFYSRKETLDFLFYSKFYEPQTTKYLSNKKGKIFLDIGSHIGRFSVLGSKNFKKVIAFEANPMNYKSLIINKKLNSLNNLACFNLAVSNKKRHVLLDMPSLNTGATKISKKGKIRAKTTVLDKFLKDKKITPLDIDLLLIDVEGHEDKVLKGAKRFLKETKADLIIECFDTTKIEKFLREFDYKKFKCLDFYNYLFVKI